MRSRSDVRHQKMTGRGTTATLLLAIAVLSLGMLSACGAYHNKRWDVFYSTGDRPWSINIPLTWSMDCSAFPADEAAMIERSFQFWDDKSPDTLFSRLPCDDPEAMITLDKVFDLGGAAGRTKIKHVDGYIYGAEIVFSPKWSEFHRAPYMETVVRHEIGHTLGMSHIQDYTCIMNPVVRYSLKTVNDGCSEELYEFDVVYGVSEGP